MVMKVVSVGKIIWENGGWFYLCTLFADSVVIEANRISILVGIKKLICIFFQFSIASYSMCVRLCKSDP